jgi:hypothetical protein
MAFVYVLTLLINHSDWEMTCFNFRFLRSQVLQELPIVAGLIAQSVPIAIRYGLDGPEIEFLWG